MNFEQKARDKKKGMSLAELEEFLAKCKRLGASLNSMTSAAVSMTGKLQKLSVEFDNEVWSD